MLGIIVRRSLLLLGLTLLTGSVLVPQSSFAVDVDKGLKDLLKDKSVELVPVVMIYHEPVTIGDLTFELDRLTPEKRRKSALQALKRKNRKVQQDALNLLEDPGMSDHVKNVRHLYMAGAISFQASREAVESLAGLADNATLFYNQGFDMTAATSRGPRPGEKVLTDRADTTWNIKWIDADRVWNELGYTGAGVVVGHIDSGVLVSHSDLVNQLYINVAEVPGNGIDDDMNGYVDDWRGWDFGLGDNNPNDDGGSPGHGTHTAGTVAGDGTGGTHTGVAPGAKIMGCKVADATGSMTLGAIWEAQQYCAENGARIITMSLGIPGEVPASYMRTERVIADNLRGLGVTFFNSAGNNNYDADEPPIELGMTARVPSPWTVEGTAYSNTGGVITIGGTGYRSDAMYGSSSRGPAKWDDVDPYNDWPYLPGPGLIKPDVSAPGVNINSTTVSGGYSGETWSGTSMSTPLVAGVAALMLEKNPSLSPAGIDSLLQLNAIDFGTVGKDNNYGAGRIDAYATLMATPETILADLHQSRVLPDPSGDGVLDPGENSTMAFEITNASP
nr:S8 family serine peptidase [Candidatus Krumholzibacteria bacterium]